ncbi:MAG: hypothetical protein ACYDD4_00680 [Acidimicrobiales bacterium]
MTEEYHAGFVHSAVIGSVTDDGPGLTDPMAGYRCPPGSAERGRGLWVTRNVCDGLKIAGDPSGTAARAWFQQPAH